MIENKQEICNAICEMLQHTSAAGDPRYNNLKEIRYVVDGGDEYAVPVFADGTGEPNKYHPHGFYAVNISGNSGIAIVIDVINKFVRRMW